MRSALAFSEMEVSFAGAGLRAFGCQQNANRKKFGCDDGLS